MRTILHRTGFVVAAAMALMLVALRPTFSQTSKSDGTSPQASGSAGGPQNPPSDETEEQVNPVTGLTTAQSSQYTPLTAYERWKFYLKQTYWSVGAYFNPVLTAVVQDQLVSQPTQWGSGLPGFGRRLASRFAEGNVVENSYYFPLAFTSPRRHSLHRERSAWRRAPVVSCVPLQFFDLQ